MKPIVINGRDFYLVGGRLVPAIAGGMAESTVLIIALAVSVAAAGVSAYMQYQQGQQAAAGARRNARLAENQAILAQQAAEARARDIRTRNRRIRGSLVAAVGGAGVTLEPGTSPLAVLASNTMEGELDALRVQYGGAREAEGLRDQAAFYRFAGRQAAYAGTVGAGTTLLSGLGQAGLGYYQMSRPTSGASPVISGDAYQSYRGGERSSYFGSYAYNPSYP